MFNDNKTIAFKIKLSVNNFFWFVVFAFSHMVKKIKTYTEDQQN